MTLLMLAILTRAWTFGMMQISSSPIQTRSKWCLPKVKSTLLYHLLYPNEYTLIT